MQESSSPLLANTSELIQIGCRSDLACLLGRSEKSVRSLAVFRVVMLFHCAFTGIKFVVITDPRQMAVDGLLKKL